MNLNKRLITEVDVTNKIVLVRLDLNVPIIDGKITSFKRIDETLPTLKYLIDNNARIVILSHLGRPNCVRDLNDPAFSLKLVAKTIADKLGNLTPKVSFVNANKGAKVEELVSNLKTKEILVLENTRFQDVDKKEDEYIGLESNNDQELAQYWASLCDVFVNDAYGAAHRKHASTYGIASFQPNNAIGFLMYRELTQLNKVVNEPIRPFTILFGGAKVSDKLLAVKSALNKADKVIISGGMAYTFLAAQGYDMGNSKVEKELIPLANELFKEYKDKIVISSDFLCAQSFANIPPIYKTKEDGLDGLIGLDIGAKSIKEFEDIIAKSNSILWNGPMGVTEFSHYTVGTNKICEAIAERTKLGALTVIGGGDSAAAAEKLNKESSFSWISTGGGASLVMLSGNDLVALDPIGTTQIHKTEKGIHKFLLDNKYIEEYQAQEAKKQGITKETTDIYTYFVDLSKSNPLLAKNAKKAPANPMEETTTSIKRFLDPPADKTDFSLTSNDPWAVYDQFMVVEMKEQKPVEKVIKKETIKKTLIIQNAGTTIDELERLKRLKKKGLSAAGLKILGKINSQKEELANLESSKK